MTLLGMLALRADHGDGVGAGHLGRCLALAQAWRDLGGDVVLLSDRRVPTFWAAAFASDGVVVELAPADAWPSASAYCVDGYRFGPATQRAVPADGPLLVIDDFGQVAIERADAILDQNPGAEGRPSWPARAVQLIGPRYALLRRDIVPPPGRVIRRIGPPRSILLSCGGDPKPEWWELLDVAVGIADSGMALERRRLAGIADVGAALLDAGVGLFAAGTTSLEAMTCGLPIVVVSFVGNQAGVARALGRSGAAIDAGDAVATSPGELAKRLRPLLEDGTLRESLSLTGRRLVDGRGASRVAESLAGLTLPQASR